MVSQNSKVQFKEHEVLMLSHLYQSVAAQNKANVRQSRLKATDPRPGQPKQPAPLANIAKMRSEEFRRRGRSTRRSTFLGTRNVIHSGRSNTQYLRAVGTCTGN